MAATETTGSTPKLTGRAAPWLAPWVAGPTRRLIPLDRRSGRHAYFRLAGTSQVVVLEGPAGLRLPIAIALTRPVLVRAMAGRRARLGQNCLEVDDQPIAVSCAGDRPARFRTDAATVRRARMVLDTLMAALPGPDVPPEVWRAVARFAAALAAGDGLVMAAGGLIGLGPGSTPAGDDVLAAALATLIAVSLKSKEAGRIGPAVASLREAIATHPGRTTPLSAALLAAAADGHMIPRLARCLEHLIRGEPAGAALRALCGVGHSSGYFLAVGAGLGLSAVAGAPQPASWISATTIAR